MNTSRNAGQTHVLTVCGCELLLLIILYIWHLREHVRWVCTWAYACICVSVCVWLCEAPGCWKNAHIKPQGMEGTPHLPPTEKVKLFNINSGSGHHADYATITVLRTASRDHLHPRTHHMHPLFALPVLTRPFGIKNHPEREPCRRPMQTYINTFSHDRPQSRSFMRVLALTQRPPAPYATPHSWKYDFIWWKCENAQRRTCMHMQEEARTHH